MATGKLTTAELMVRLRADLDALAQRRRAVLSDPLQLAARLALQQFQLARLRMTHADLLAAPESAAATRFFVNELYGAQNVLQRDVDVRRVLPTMERMLPLAALAAVAEAIRLDALSDELDMAMAAQLGVHFDASDYARAYRHSTPQALREQQLQYVAAAGVALCKLVRIPLLKATLGVMRGPAKLAKLTELHGFLERGFAAFKVMQHPDRFVATVVARERQIMQELYARNDAGVVF